MKFFEKLAQKFRDFSAKRGYTCDGCGGEVFEYPVKRLCGRCEEKLSRNDGEKCGKCGRKTLAQGICLSCKSKLPVFDKGITPFVYRGETASLVNRIKNGNRRLSWFFGEEMAAAFLREFLQGKTVSGTPVLILPVPATAETRKIRGYNQAEELAHVVETHLKGEGILAESDFEALEKRRDTAQQKHLSIVEREKNVSGAYHLHKRKICKGRTVLLVDDIMTTGATGSECARLLKNAGAKEVIFLTAAMLPERK